MLCIERRRLVSIYIAVIAKNYEARNVIPSLHGKGWREEQRDATKNIHVACETAIADLNRHRAEHGC
jgi:hypothetical protein